MQKWLISSQKRFFCGWGGGDNYVVIPMATLFISKYSFLKNSFNLTLKMNTSCLRLSASREERNIFLLSSPSSPPVFQGSTTRHQRLKCPSRVPSRNQRPRPLLSRSRSPWTLDHHLFSQFIIR